MRFSPYLIAWKEWKATENGKKKKSSFCGLLLFESNKLRKRENYKCAYNTCTPNPIQTVGQDFMTRNN